MYCTQSLDRCTNPTEDGWSRHVLQSLQVTDWHPGQTKNIIQACWQHDYPYMHPRHPSVIKEHLTPSNQPTMFTYCFSNAMKYLLSLLAHEDGISTQHFWDYLCLHHQEALRVTVLVPTECALACPSVYHWGICGCSQHDLCHSTTQHMNPWWRQKQNTRH